AADHWTTRRRSVAHGKTRLAQYALLGVGGIRLLQALAFDPAVLHLNEGHPALAPLELAANAVSAGRPFDEALGEVRARTVFTTHTPVPAGNETYPAGTILSVLGSFPDRLGISQERFLDLGRITPGSD